MRYVGNVGVVLDPDLLFKRITLWSQGHLKIAIYYHNLIAFKYMGKYIDQFDLIDVKFLYTKFKYHITLCPIQFYH